MGFNMRTKQQFLLMLGFAVSVFSAPASAAIQWTLNTGLSCSGGTSFPYNSCNKTTSGVNVEAKAWSTTVNSANTALERAYLGVYGGSGGGLGVTNRDGVTGCSTGKDCAEGTPTSTTPPEHALDSNERYDSILFSFSSLIQLTHLGIGYPSSTGSIDSDLTILAYTGAGIPDLTGDTYEGASGLTTQGWTLVGHYSNVANTDPTSVNAGGYSSQYWLVAGYTPSFGGSCSGCDAGDDYAKLLSLKGDKTTNVSEPNTLLLIGVGAIAGLWGRRRRKMPS